MSRRQNHFPEILLAPVALVPMQLSTKIDILKPRCISTPRASWEVCPKHRNIRRELLRVRGRRSTQPALLRTPGKGFCSFKPLRHAKPSTEQAIDWLFRGGSSGGAFFISMKQDVTNPEVVKTRAAAYVRMSTDHQKYSTENQLDAIREFAERRGMEIIEIYSDEGKSGLNIHGRA